MGSPSKEGLTNRTKTPIGFNASWCVRGKSRLSQCQLCADVCPTSAIKYEQLPVLHVEACNLCGLCLHTCPVGAFIGEDGVSDLLRCCKELGLPSTVELSCKRNPRPDYGPLCEGAVIQTNQCLAMIGPSVYFGLYAQGVRSIRIRLEMCSSCPIGNLKDAIFSVAQQAWVFAEGMGGALEVHAITQPGEGWGVREVFSTQRPPFSRRSFFRLAAMEAAGATAKLLLDQAQDDTQQRGLPLERRRLLAALAELKANSGLSPREKPAAFPRFTRLTVVDEACNACGACARACPTQALEGVVRKEDGLDTFHLAFSVQRCVNCGICRDICPKQALTESGKPFFHELIEESPRILFKRTMRQCSRCKVQFIDMSGEKSFCPKCIRQRSIYERLTVSRNSMPI